MNKAKQLKELSKSIRVKAKAVDRDKIELEGLRKKLQEEVRTLQKHDVERLTDAAHGWPELFRRPNRGDINDPKISWVDKTKQRCYFKADHLYLTEKTKQHKKDSVEDIAENLVKLWEFEATHKENLDEWTSVIPRGKDGKHHYEISYTDFEYDKHVTTKITRTMDGKWAKEVGNYTALMHGCKEYRKLLEAKKTDEQLAKGDMSDYEVSHDIFRTCFPEGFGWEVLKVTSGPKPAHDGQLKYDGKEVQELSFTWRHWAKLIQTSNGEKADARNVELTGSCNARVIEQPDGSYKLKTFEICDMNSKNFLETCSMARKPADQKGAVGEKPVYNADRHGELTYKIKDIYEVYEDDQSAEKQS